MQTLFIKTPNISAHVDRIDGFIIRRGSGETVARVPGTSIAVLCVHDAAAARRAMLDEGWDPEDFVGWEQPRSAMADKMQQFVPGIVPGQRLFYHVAATGTVEGHWLVPGAQASNIRGPATDHPLGIGPEPGWYDSSGNKLARDPREVAP